MKKSALSENRFNKFKRNALRAVKEAVEKLKSEECVICSTEVLESVFGKYKEINKKNQGITGNILGIATFVGTERAEDEIKEVMKSAVLRQQEDGLVRRWAQP